MSYKEIEGDLISLALQGEFDAIVHGVNCFGVQKSGIAKRMNEVFKTNDPIKYRLESFLYKGDINKLGSIEYVEYCKFTETEIIHPRVTVINAYTQYNFSGQEYFDNHKPVDYDAITLCMRKINFKFKGLHIGLPLIGCGLAGGDWNIVKPIIQKELKDMNVTVVNYKKD